MKLGRCNDINFKKHPAIWSWPPAAHLHSERSMLDIHSQPWKLTRSDRSLNIWMFHLHPSFSDYFVHTTNMKRHCLACSLGADVIAYPHSMEPAIWFLLHLYIGCPLKAWIVCTVHRLFSSSLQKLALIWLPVAQIADSETSRHSI